MLKHYSCSEAYEQIIFQDFVYKDSIKKEIENIWNGQWTWILTEWAWNLRLDDVIFLKRGIAIFRSGLDFQLIFKTAKVWFPSLQAADARLPSSGYIYYSKTAKSIKSSNNYNFVSNLMEWSDTRDIQAFLVVVKLGISNI